MWGSVLQVGLAARPVKLLQGSGILGCRKAAAAGRWNRRPHPRATDGAGHKSGSESSDRYFYRSERGPGYTPEWRACRRSLRKVAFASNWFPERIREVIWQRSDDWHPRCI